MNRFFTYCIFISCFYSCSESHLIERTHLKPQVLNDEIETIMPGNLLLVNDYLVWSDPFSMDYFLHVHDAVNGKELGSMGRKGEGPQEFVSPLISRHWSDHAIFAYDANGNTRGYLSVDSLIVGKEPFLGRPDVEKKLGMIKLDNGLYISETEDGEADYFKLKENDKESTFGVYPISEVKQHVGSYETYDKERGLFVYASFKFPYLALYKKDGDTFRLRWEHVHGEKNYANVDGAIVFDRKIMGMGDVCMSKDYIITLERDREVDPMDESAVGRNASKCPRTVFLYDFDGHLLKIVDLDMPIMRIAANGKSNSLYAIGVNPDFVLVKYDL